MIQGKRNNKNISFYNQNNYKIKVLEGFDWILQHRNIIQKEKKWLKTSKPPMFGGSFQVPNMRWRVWKLVFLTAAGQIDQKNQLKQVTQCKKCSKTAAKVSKKVTTFGKNIRPEQCQPYVYVGQGKFLSENPTRNPFSSTMVVYLLTLPVCDLTYWSKPTTQDNSFCYDLFYLVSSLVDGSPVCCTVKCLVIRLLCGNLTWRRMFSKTLREPRTAANMKGTSANLLLDA